MNSKVGNVATLAEVLDVVIIGAGLSGIGAAVHLKKNCPNKSFAILEARTASGGTWDLFRYPGIRSDSDMYTFGYKFKPWTNPKSIADGKDICDYIRETATEYNIDDKIRYQHKFISADWSSRQALWSLVVEEGATGNMVTIQAKFIISGSGYYRYEKGLTPDFSDSDTFSGEIIHPQLWPEDFDYSGKEVVVIGSGATAVTLVPAMAKIANHVTMLQRSPTYVASVPEKDPMIDSLRKVFSEKIVYSITRTRNVLLGMAFFQVSQRYPEKVRSFLSKQIKKELGDDVDMTHFTPKYNPWDQRLCAVPDGDMFKAIREGHASIVTDHIERFTKKGILLKSGKELPADIIVTATGLDVQILGGAQLSLDGIPIDVSKKHYYKGAMLEDLPNFAMIFGYTNSSWTLKADMISEYVCKVINYMDKEGYAQATPRVNKKIEHSLPFLNLSSSYVQRVMDQVPRQGDRKPWLLYQNYFQDYRAFKFKRINDNTLVFSNPVSHGYGYDTEKKNLAIAQ